MRGLSAGDFDTAQRILAWPTEEALHAYRAHLRRIERDAYERAVLLWTLRAPWAEKRERPPSMPYWMKEEALRGR